MNTQHCQPTDVSATLIQCKSTLNSLLRCFCCYDAFIVGHFDSKAMPSAGLLPFFQSMFCAANNTCYPTEQPSEQPGIVSSYNTSLYVLFIAALCCYIL